MVEGNEERFHFELFSCRFRVPKKQASCSGKNTASFLTEPLTAAAPFNILHIPKYSPCRQPCRPRRAPSFPSAQSSPPPWTLHPAAPSAGPAGLGAAAGAAGGKASKFT
eukprot:1147567-Pelagomonas_calceolata.AAC.2